MGKLNMDAMKSQLNAESQNSYSNAEYDKLQQGKNVRRVLWPKGDNELFYSDGYLHFGIGPEGKSVATCPKTWGQKEKCPICEMVEQLQKSKSKDDKKLADDIKAKRRIYINVINRDDEEETPKVLPIGATIFKGLLETICDADYGDITDPETGHDVTITRKGQGLKTEYTVLPKPKATVVSDTQTPEEIEAEMTDLNSLFIKKSYDELKALLDGEEAEDNEDEDEDTEEEEEEEDDGYDSMELDELESLCKKRKIKLPVKPNRLKLVTLLTKWDEEHEDEEDNDEADDEDDVPFDTKDSESDEAEDKEEDDDEVQDAIAAALARRKKGAKK